jgi:hypothetical protein
MDALKTATKNLLTQLKTAAGTNGDVYVSIVPFSKDVNVGSSNYAASWLDWDDWEDDNGSWQTSTSCSRGSSRRGRSRCTSNQTWVSADHSTWNGCVTDRGNFNVPTGQGYDQNVDPPINNNPQSLYPAEQYSYCPVQVMGLSYDWTALNSKVDAMTPVGSTNQPIGLVWGWLSLAGGGPFTVPAMDSQYPYSQVIILLSDGLNTQDRWYGNGSSVSTDVDARMYDPEDGSGTCKNIKAAGITIYTVHVNTDGDPMSTLLQNCASNTPGTTDHFFMLTSANQMVSTFNTIGTNLARLRVAK